MTHDPDILEAAARALRDDESMYEPPLELVMAMLAAVTPLIEAAALERAAQVAELAGSDFDTCNEIAAAIRALKEQP